jgi:hypothetical protein
MVNSAGSSNKSSVADASNKPWFPMEENGAKDANRPIMIQTKVNRRRELFFLHMLNPLMKQRDHRRLTESAKEFCHMGSSVFVKKGWFHLLYNARGHKL